MTTYSLYAIVLASSASHASWNAILKSSGDRLLTLASIRVVGLAAGVAVASIVPLPSVESVPYLLGAAAVHYVYYALMLKSYRVGEMSQAYPIARGTAPILVAVLGAEFADETLDPESLVAIGLVSCGIVVLAFSGRKMNESAVAFAIGTGASIAGYSFLSGMGVRRAESLFGYVAWLEIATGVGVTLVTYVRRRRNVLEFVSKQWRSGLCAGLLSVAGYAIVLWAMSRAPMAPVIALRETSVVFAAILGSVLLKEGFATIRVTAAGVVAVGVALIGFAAR